MPNTVQSSWKQTTMSKEISEGIKSLLGKTVQILLKAPVKLESKGDRIENRILVFCPCRLFCVKIPNPRVDFHFHYLELQSIESKKSNNLLLTANEKSYSFVIHEHEKVDLVDKMIGTLLTALTDTFPGIPLTQLVRRVDVSPTSRMSALDICLEQKSGCLNEWESTVTTSLPCPKSRSSSSLSEEALAVRTCLPNNAGPSGLPSYQNTTVSYVGPSGTTSSPCGGFSTQYAWMCDLHGLPYREEVAWDVDTIYLSHDSRELCLHDFDHLEPRDSVPILSALEYNTWFKTLRLSNVKLSQEAIERFLHIIRKSQTIEELFLDNIGAKADFALKLSFALSSNSNSQVHTIDLSHNMIEDKGAIHLSNSLAKLCRGPVWLNMAQCGLSPKGVAQLAQALVLNKSSVSSLTHLNLSGNSVKDDVNNLCNFLAQPNAVSELDLSGTDCVLETVFGALVRGSTSNLTTLNLSKNNFSTKKGKEIPPSFKQFLTSSLALKHLSLASSRLSLDALKQLLLGLACNESVVEVELDVSSNALGAQGAHVLESCLPTIKCLSSLDISENNLEGELAAIVTAASKNKSLKHMNLGKNLQSTKPKHVAQVMEAIVQVLQDEECVLESLSLADSKLKVELYSVINALGSNQCLQNINISGNHMGDVGARLLAKGLQINSKLRSITYDKNNITLQGFSDIAYGLESNQSVRYMPFPLHDSTACMKVSAERTESVMKRIQDLVHRNSFPKKRTNGHQAFRLQQGFLLSSAQQTVDKLVGQTQESIESLRKADSYVDSEDMTHESVITHAEKLIKDSENAKQLVLNLYDILEPKREGWKALESKLAQIAEELQNVLSEHLHVNMEQVIRVTEERCPIILSHEVKTEIREGCLQKNKISQEFVRHCLLDISGTDIIQKLNEVQLAMAGHIADKLVDTVIDSLTKCQKELKDLGQKRSSTPDVLRTRLRSSPSESSKEAGESSNVFNNSPHFADQSPMATPQLHLKRRGLHGRRIRPKSVVDCVEGISADDIPDLLPSLPRTIEESIVSLVELPPVSPQQLKHLGKARPKKPKTRAPTRSCLRQDQVILEVSEGVDTFFRPGSTTPTPIVTPDSEECSTSLMISSMTSGGGAEDCSLLSPTHSSRTYKAEAKNSEETSANSFDSCSLGSKLSLDTVPRSKSTDCLEKQGIKREPLLTPTHQSSGGAVQVHMEIQKSPVPKSTLSIGSSVVAEIKAFQGKRSSVLQNTNEEMEIVSSPIREENISTSMLEGKEKLLKGTSHVGSSGLGLVNRRPPPLAPKPRPWSVLANRHSGDFSLGSDGSSPNASAANTPDAGEILENSAAAVETVRLPGNCKGETISNNSKDSGGIEFSFGSSSGSSGDCLAQSGPGSLPAWSQSELGWSVKEMAASLTRQQATEETKKTDILLKNESATTTASSQTLTALPQSQEGLKPRVTLQEWSRHHSADWRPPLRKVSTDISNRAFSKS